MTTNIFKAQLLQLLTEPLLCVRGSAWSSSAPARPAGSSDSRCRCPRLKGPVPWCSSLPSPLSKPQSCPPRAASPAGSHGGNLQLKGGKHSKTMRSKPSQIFTTLEELLSFWMCASTHGWKDNDRLTLMASSFCALVQKEYRIVSLQFSLHTVPENLPRADLLEYFSETCFSLWSVASNTVGSSCVFTSSCFQKIKWSKKNIL